MTVKVLVTGATGFMGHNFMDFLAALPKTIEVYALIRDPDKAAMFSDYSKRLHLIFGDVLKPETLTELPPDLDFVFHMAALVSLKNGPEFYPVNAEGTQNLINALANQKKLKRFVLLSSISAVDRTEKSKPPYKPLTETSSSVPRTDYGKSKLQAETRLISSGLPYTILRPAYIYGPHPRKGSSVDRIIQDTWTENPYTRFPFTGHVSEIYAPDLAEIMWQVAHTEQCLNETYFVANPEPVAVQDWFKTLYHLMKKPYSSFPLPKLMAGSLKGMMKKEGLDPIMGEILFHDYFVCSPQKLYQHISYRPYYGFGPGMAKTLQWYQEHNHLGAKSSLSTPASTAS